MSYMGPGFLMFFPVGEAVLGPPFQIPLNLVRSVSTKGSVTKHVTFSLKVTQKSEHSLKIIS